MGRSTISNVERIVQLLLLGLGAAAFWVLLSFFTPATSAHAEETPPPPGGVTGLLSDVVHGVVGVANGTVSAVGEAVPVLQPVTGLVTTTVDAVDTTVSATTGAVAGTVQQLPVSAITDPVLDTVGAVVDAVPVVNEVVDATGLLPTLSGTTHAVDDTLSTVVAGPLPMAPALPGRTPDVLAGVDSLAHPLVTATTVASTPPRLEAPVTALAPVRHAPVPSTSSTFVPATAEGISAVEAPPSEPGTPPSAPAGSVSGSTACSAPGGNSVSPGVVGPPDVFDPCLLGHRTSLVGDYLPSSPVFATDSSPD